MTLKQRIRESAFSNGLDYVGIATMEKFCDSPEKHRPDVLLPGARSVISMGKKLSKEGLISHSNFYHRQIRNYFTSLWFGYGAINLHFLDETALIITRLLERRGYIAFPIIGIGIENYRKAPMATVSHRHAAVATFLIDK